MGEEVDLSQFGEIEEKKVKQFDEAAVKKAKALLKAEKSRDFIKSELHKDGYTFEACEKAVSIAETGPSPEQQKRIQPKLIFLVAVVALSLVGALLFVFTGTSGSLDDCGEDTFCVQKISTCTGGRYQSSYRGVTYSYSIEQSDSYCSVFVKVIKSDSPSIPKGLEMDCLHPVVGGKTEIDGSNCGGGLVPLLFGS